MVPRRGEVGGGVSPFKDQHSLTPSRNAEAGRVVEGMAMLVGQFEGRLKMGRE